MESLPRRAEQESRRHRASPVEEHHDEPNDKEHSHMTTEKAILAGGCFWGMQDLIRRQPGVIATRVGYSGGDVKNATYRNHGTHAEAIEVIVPSYLYRFRRTGQYEHFTLA